MDGTGSVGLNEMDRVRRLNTMFFSHMRILDTDFHHHSPHPRPRQGRGEDIGKEPERKVTVRWEKRSCRWGWGEQEEEGEQEGEGGRNKRRGRFENM